MSSLGLRDEPDLSQESHCTSRMCDALNFQVLASHPGITFPDFCATQGPHGSSFAMGISPVCSRPRLLKQM